MKTDSYSSVKYGNGQNVDFIDPLLSISFFEVHSEKSHLQPEKVLMLAILQDAVTCIQRYASSKGIRARYFRETIEWIGKDDDDWLFSFNNICDALEIDTASLRLALLNMAQTHIGRGRIGNRTIGRVAQRLRLVRAGIPKRRRPN